MKRSRETKNNKFLKLKGNLRGTCLWRSDNVYHFGRCPFLFSRRLIRMEEVFKSGIPKNKAPVKVLETLTEAKRSNIRGETHITQEDISILSKKFQEFYVDVPGLHRVLRDGLRDHRDTENQAAP